APTTTAREGSGHRGRAIRDYQAGPGRGGDPQLSHRADPGHPRPQRLGEPCDLARAALRHRLHEFGSRRALVPGPRPQGRLATPRGPRAALRDRRPPANAERRQLGIPRPNRGRRIRQGDRRRRTNPGDAQVLDPVRDPRESRGTVRKGPVHDSPRGRAPAGIPPNEDVAPLDPCLSAGTASWQIMLITSWIPGDVLFGPYLGLTSRCGSRSTARRVTYRRPW